VSPAFKYINDVNRWPNTLFITGLTASMAVNALVTGMIVFRILKVTRVKPSTSVERTLGSTGRTKLRHLIFIIIESGMALFAIQLVRVVQVIKVPAAQVRLFAHVGGEDIVVVVNQMLNVIIIRSVHFYFFCFMLTFT
jgi:hypothetical protein